MTTEVQPRNAPLPNLAAMFTGLNEVAQDMEDVADTAALQIIEQLLSAETEEDLFRAQNSGTIAGKDYVNRPFRLSPADIDWRRSRAAFIDQGGFPFFFFAGVTEIETGQRVIINCGGKTIVAMMWKLLQLGAFDRFTEKGGRCFMLQSNAALSGYEYLTLMPIADPLDPPVTPAAGNGRKQTRG